MSSSGNQIVPSMRAALEKMKPQFAMVLPKHMTADRMFRMSMTVFTQNPYLQKCDVNSFIAACMQSAQLGLYPENTVLGHAYFVPFKGKIQLIPGYRGLIDLARRSGQVATIMARAVFESDHFFFEHGLVEKLEHREKKPDKEGIGHSDGDLVAVYAVVRFLDQRIDPEFEVMWRHQVLEIMKRSPSIKANKGGPWITDFIPMALKTVIRRVTKYLPLSVDLQRAVALDEMAAAGIEQNLVIDVTPEPDIPIPPTPDDSEDTVDADPLMGALDGATEEAKESQKSSDEPTEFDLLWLKGIEKFGDEEWPKKFEALRRSLKLKSSDGTSDKLISGIKQTLGIFD